MSTCVLQKRRVCDHRARSQTLADQSRLDSCSSDFADILCVGPAILRNGARSINLASGTLRVKPMKPSPPPMRPLHTPALTVNTPERMTNGLTTSPVQKADGKRFTAICVESKLENEKAQKVHSETQTHACFGYKPKVCLLSVWKCHL